jgi:hypothetical protein
MLPTMFPFHSKSLIQVSLQRRNSGKKNRICGIGYNGLNERGLGRWCKGVCNKEHYKKIQYGECVDDATRVMSWMDQEHVLTAAIQSLHCSLCLHHLHINTQSFISWRSRLIPLDCPPALPPPPSPHFLSLVRGSLYAIESRTMAQP